MMTAQELIDAYVSDVARLLPRKDREDVAMELRALLHEELAAKDAGTSRDTAALELLRAFGRPAEVAARYGRPLTVIDQADTRRFVRMTVIGILVIWLLGLISVLAKQNSTLETVRDWWQSYGIQALWWPGFLLVCFGGAGWVRRRWPNTARWKPRLSATDHVSRPGRVAALVFFVTGLFVLVNAAWLLEKVSGGRAAPEAIIALSYTGEFVRLRGPIVLVLMVVSLIFYLVVTVQGRWKPRTRALEVTLNLIMCGVFSWVLFAGPIYQSLLSDRVVKLALAVIVAVTLIDVIVQARRARLRFLRQQTRSAAA